MYWKFIGHDIDEDSMKSNIIYKLGNFLISKPDFFYFTIDIIISCKAHSHNNLKYDLERVKLRLKRALMDGSIQSTDSEYFLELFSEYSENNRIKKGFLLEYIIYKIGPFNLPFEGINKITECRVLIDEELYIQKDFDVVFYKKTETGDIFAAEIIECKLDLNTFIHNPPSNKASFSDEARDKLKIMKMIYEKQRENDIFWFYLTTLRKKINSCEEILKINGFDFIKIINGEKIYEMLKNHGVFHDRF